MMQGIKDKVVVINGASGGLGEAAARRLGARRRLVLGARRIERLEALAKELSLGDDAAVRTDVTRHEEVKRLVVDVNEILFRPTSQEY